MLDLPASSLEGGLDQSIGGRIVRSSMLKLGCGSVALIGFGQVSNENFFPFTTLNSGQIHPL